MRYEVLSVDPDSTDMFYWVITLHRIPGVIGQILGQRPRVEQFRGNGTVWHNVATGLRAGCTGNLLHDFVVGSTIMESRLFRIWNTRKKVA